MFAFLKSLHTSVRNFFAKRIAKAIQYTDSLVKAGKKNKDTMMTVRGYLATAAFIVASVIFGYTVGFVFGAVLTFIFGAVVGPLFAIVACVLFIQDVYRTASMMQMVESFTASFTTAAA